MDSQHTYLSGPSVCGFYGAFEADYGDPNTSRPYPRVTPSRVGEALLPFPCPHCGETIDFSNPEKREAYHDTRETANGKRRDNYWCPCCHQRFCMNLKGKSFSGKLSDGAAPAEVETITVGEDGMVDYKRSTVRPVTIMGAMFRNYILGTDILGCCQ